MRWAGGNEVGQQLGEPVGIEPIGFDLAAGNGFQAGRGRQHELNAEVVQQICQPVPEPGGLDDRPMRSR
jgi:hypothetical protein